MSKLLLGFLLIAGTVFPASRIDELIERGLEHSYNFEWAAAEKMFDQAIHAYPNDPRGYHYKSNLYFWNYLSGKKEEDLKKFFEYSDLAIEKGEAVLDKDSDNENALYILGSNHGFRSIIFFSIQENLKAVWAGKNSKSYLTKTLEVNPERYDAYMGLGVFKFALSFVPGVFQWALDIAGVSGTKEEGIACLRKAYTKGKYARTEAGYYLSQIYTGSVAKYDSAAYYLKSLLAEYPNNSLFDYSYAVVLLKQRRPADAENHLDNVIRKAGDDANQIVSYSYFLKGDAAFIQNKFEEGKEYYQKFLSTTTGKDYTGIANYRLALCYCFLDNFAEAKKHFESAQKGNMELSDDIYARRKGHKYTEREISKTELEVIKFANEIEAGKYDKAYDSLQILAKEAKDQISLSEINFYLSDAAYHLGKYGKAESFASRAITYDSRDEKWVKPFAYYTKALANRKLNNADEYKENLEKAASYNDYEYYDKLSSMIEAQK
jgi:tetratricopeptide (TPR) repeat protein